MNKIGSNNYPIIVTDLEETIEIKSDNEMIEYVSNSILKYSEKFKDFNVKDYLDYINVKIPIDKRSEQLIELYYFNKTNPFNINEIPYILYQSIILINSIKDGNS